MAFWRWAALRASTGRTGLFVTMSVPLLEAVLELGSRGHFETLAAAEVDSAKAADLVVDSR